MNSAASPTSRRPAGRGFVLLVLAVLAGVLGMHGLAPGGAPTAHPHRADAAVHGVVHGAHGATEDCAQPSGGDGSPHLEHADGTCAAAGIGSPYAPPALTAATAHTPAAATPPAGPQGETGGGRAPPDLAELQLLRM
ncbi:DUF6153 family protein [Streptomyces sp. NPDC044571]|uniref:DUF6153 family protein n=1 Tax=Streptomyces sp. NPDC044571 TaxID=3155371 RepID=UPI00340581F2